MKKLYKYRFYPTPIQEEYFRNVFGSVRWVYNHVLNWRYETWSREKRFIGFAESSRYLTRLRNTVGYSWLSEIPFMPLQQALRDQDKTFENLFKKRTNKPVFRKKASVQTIRYCGAAFYCKKGIVRVARLKQPLRIRWSRPLPSVPTTVQITMESSGRYYINFTCEVEEKVLPDTDTKIGIDVGITTFASLSDGRRIENPRYHLKREFKVKKLQKKLSRQKRGSSNYLKTKKKLARAHANIRDARKDFLHKVSRQLINENQVICIESLKIRSMVKNHSLAKHIADASWGDFFTLLTQKAEEARRQIRRIWQYEPSSKKCNVCSLVLKKLPLSVREWRCEGCNTLHDRDTNAAINILNAGLPWANTERFNLGLRAL